MKLNKKRRIENKTDYRKRLILLKGNSPRLVIRKTNRYMILQIIESKESQDYIKYSAVTKELLEYGWPKEMSGSLKSVSASYLTGYLLGKKAESLKGRVISDTGLMPNTKGSRIYAAIKGIADSGIKINYGKGVEPKEERIKGKNAKAGILEAFDKIKKSIESYKPKAKKEKKQ
ncbi:MAG: 50S ribosomal protein L18 [Candidatus Nanoarchaeia archaeon]